MSACLGPGSRDLQKIFACSRRPIWRQTLCAATLLGPALRAAAPCPPTPVRVLRAKPVIRFRLSKGELSTSSRPPHVTCTAAQQHPHRACYSGTPGRAARSQCRGFRIGCFCRGTSLPRDLERSRGYAGKRRGSRPPTKHAPRGSTRGSTQAARSGHTVGRLGQPRVRAPSLVPAGAPAGPQDTAALEDRAGTRCTWPALPDPNPTPDPATDLYCVVARWSWRPSRPVSATRVTCGAMRPRPPTG